MSDYSSTYPTQSPVFAFDAKAGKLDSRISYSRSSTGTYMSSEKSLNSENLLKNSQDYSSVWAKQYIADPAGSQTAPDGSSTAFKLTSTSEASAAPTIYQASLNLAATTHTAIVHLKAGTASHGFISIRTSSGNSAYAMINFSAGTVGNGHYGTVTGSSSTVTALGSDWFKVTLTATTVAATNAFVFIGSSDGTVPTSSGYPMWTTSGQTIFVWGAQLSSTNSKVYDSPTTTQISREYSPLLKTAAADAARFEYAADGQSVGTAKGLLVESQSTNLATYAKNGYDASNAFQWSISEVVPTENAAVAPSGSLEATLIQENSVTGQHAFSKNIFASAAAHTFSFYVKDAGVGNIGIRLIGPTNIGRSFNLTDNSTGAFFDAPTSYGIEDVGNGWKRVYITATLTAATWSFYIYCFRGAGSVSYAGDGYSGFLFYGAQLEANSSPSSWVDTGTGGSTATRAADSCSVDLTSVGNEVTVAAEAISTAVTSDRETVFHITPLNANTVSAYAGRTAGGGASNVFYGGSSGVYLTGGTVTAGSAYKFALRTAPANHGMSYNGGTVATQTTTVSGDDFDTLHIGSRSDGSNAINGHVKRLSLYSVALSNVELQSLTS
jgi:hypothetical protein